MSKENPYVITDQMIDDILDAAMYGITYWADDSEVVGELPDGLADSECLTHGCSLRIHAEEDDWYELTEARMADGIRKEAKRLHKTPLWLYENHDAAIADNVVQFALFGELIYG